MAPFGLPLLPVESYVAYSKAMGVAPSTAERKELSQLPQFYADMHGWDAIVSTVAEVYLGLPETDRRQAGVFAFNYGVAGAVEFLGRGRGLTRVASGHNNYWLWGPGTPPPEVVIVVGGDADGHRSVFSSVTQAATIRCGHCMPYENDNPVFVCRRPRSSLDELWPALKHFH